MQTHLAREVISRIKNNQLHVRVRPDSVHTAIRGFDGYTVLLDVKEPADKDKANIAVLKFLSKLVGKRARLRSGKTSREKVIEFVE